MSKKENTYDVGDKVFVDHGTIYYEAKILSLETSAKAAKYTIHYQGWNSRYDETIFEDKILKHNDTNAKKAKELEAALLAQEKSTPSSKKKRRIGPGLSKSSALSSEVATADQLSSRTSSPCPSQDGSIRNLKTESSGGDRKRKGRQSTPSQPSTSRAPSAAETVVPPPHPIVPSTVESEAHYKHTPEIQVKMPEDLKPVLVDDWDLITRQLKLVSLPARISVNAILDEYLKHRKGANGGSMSAGKYSQVHEAIMGIKEYFNAMLGTQLLYKFERPQYSDQVQNKETVKHSEIYGAPHLLRLFVRLGHMLAYTSLSEAHLNVIVGHVHDLLRYLSKNKARLFSLDDDYETATPEYQRAAFS